MILVLIYCYSLFLFGCFGILFIWRNFFLSVISIELMFLGNTLSFLFGAYILDDIVGLVCGLLIFVISAVETVIGLCIFVLYFRIIGELDVSFITLLKS
jgi:NADH:ubiquinone oxidoreductase subunit K